ncbi:MAG: Ig-like domain-containing protein [Lysobacteraceae bacterium]
MSDSIRVRGRYATWLAMLLLLVFAAPALAQNYQHAVLIDSDNNAATGCTVNSAAGSVSGVELRLDADVSGLPPQVASVSRSECTGATFAPPVALGGGYPVALDGGTGGADAIELAMAYVDVPNPGSTWRIALLSESSTGADLLGPFTAAGLGNAPVPPPTVAPELIPTMSPGSLIGLSVAMALLLLWGARKHRGLLSVFMLCGSLAFFGVAWAANFIADGNLGDWTGEAANASDPSGDASSGEMPIDIIAGFARREGGNVFFRIDVNDAESTNRTPAIADQGFSIDEDSTNGTAVGTVVASDPDAGDTLSYAITAGNGAGVFAIDANSGAISVIDNSTLDYETTASYALTVTVTDDGTPMASSSATVSVNVNDINEAPTAAADSHSTDEDTALNVAAPGVLGNDSDPDGDTLTAVLDTGVSNGTLTLNADGSFDYTPDPGYNGMDSFSYHANDGALDSASVTVNIAVAVVNDDPVAVDDSYSTDEDTALNVPTTGVLANDSDADSDPLTAVLDTDVSNGTLTLNADGSFSYTPNADFNGGDSFSYHANDGIADSNIATVTITVDPVNDAPQAVADNFATDEDTPLNAAAPGVLVNDSDVDADSLTAVLDTDVSDGALTLNADGSFSYTPDLDFNGTDSFSYHANDGTADSNVVTVTITVGPVNDGPNAVDDSFATDEDTVLNVAAPGVLANDTDPEGDMLAVTAYDAISTQGALVTVNADGSFSYDPTGSAALQALTAGNSVDDSFGYTIEDPGSDSDTATVTITVTGANDAPVAADDSFSTDEDTPLVVAAGTGVLINDTDIDAGDTLTAVPVTSPANGSLALNANGSFSYTPDPDFNGSDSFTYRANDGTMDSNLATVSITVNPVSDPPTAVDDFFGVPEDSGATVLSVLANDTDPDSGGLSVVSVTQPANGTTVIAGGGTGISYTPDIDYCNVPPGTTPDTFTYTLAPGGSTATVSVTVTCVDDPPTALSDAATVAEDSGATPILVLANDTDPDAGPISIASITQPANGTAAITGGGTGLTYQPDPNYCNDGVTTDTFTYTLTPGGSSATVSVTVTCVNDAPIVSPPGSFNVTGNVRIQVPDGASDLLAGASDPEGTALSVGSPAPTTTVQGGNLSINTSTGAFSYNPPAGYEGSDSFSYDICDADGACTSTSANLTVSDMVWFVDTGAAAGGDGRLATPFNSITALQSANGGASGPAAGEPIFLYSGSHSGSLTLLAGQRVYGQGATPSLAALTLITLPTFSDAFPATGGARPVWTASDAVALTLGSGNMIRGFDIAGTGTGGTDIAGTGFGTLTVDEVTLSGDGRALNLDNGAMAGAGFDAVSVFSSDTQGIRLNAVTGTVALGGGLITSTTGTAFEATGNLGTVNYGGGIVKASIGRLIDISGAGGGNITLSGNLECQAVCGTGAGEQVVRIANRSSGSVTLSGTSSTLRPTTPSPNTIVLIASNAGASINISGAMFVGSISNPVQGTAYQIAGGGTINLNGQIEAETTGARAFDIDGVTLSGNMGGQIATNGALGTAPAIEITNSAAPTGVIFGQQLILDNDDAGENGGGLRLHGNTGSYSFPSVARITSLNAMAVDVDNSGTFGMGSVSPGQATNSGGTVISVINTNIAASGMTVTNVRSSGGSSGIVLNNTGTLGSFSITGNGGACASTATCTGGVIQSTTGVGVSLTSTLTPSLAHLYVGATGSHGIHAASLSNGLTLTDVMVEDAGNADNEYGLNVQNVAGTVNITNSLFDNAADDLIHYVNTNTSGALTVTGSSFVHPATISPTANAAIAMQPNGSSTLTATITGNGFTDIRGDSIQ